MPEVTLQPDNIGSFYSAVVLDKAIRQLGDEWEVKLEGPIEDEVERRTYSGVPDPIEQYVYLVVAWDVLSRVVAERLISAVERAIREAWEQRRKRVEVIVVTKGGQEVRRVKGPRP